MADLGPWFLACSGTRAVFHSRFGSQENCGRVDRPTRLSAVPWAIMAPLIWWLRKWEEQGASPKPTPARGWGLSVMFFGIAVMVALLLLGR